MPKRRMTAKRKAQIKRWQLAGSKARGKPKGKTRFLGERPVVQFEGNLYKWDLKAKGWRRNLYETGWGKNTPAVPVSEANPRFNTMAGIKAYDENLKKLVKRSLTGRKVRRIK